MKTGYIKLMGCLLLCSVAMSSCNDNDGDCNIATQYKLTVKAVDSDQEAIKDNVSLYVFDKDSKLTNVSKCNLDVESAIKLDPSQQYSIIAIGHSPETPMPVIPLGTTIDNMGIILSTDDFVGHKVAGSPGDIFHGRIELKGDWDDDRGTIIWIRRKVAALTIITRNLQEEFNTTDEDFSYVVRKTYGTLGFDGNLKGDKVAYHPTSSINPTNHHLVAPMFYTYPSQSDDGFAIDIYKGTNLLNTYDTDSDEQQMLLKEGKHTVVVIDFNNVGDNGLLDITCNLKDWADDNIDEGFN